MLTVSQRSQQAALIQYITFSMAASVEARVGIDNKLFVSTFTGQGDSVQSLSCYRCMKTLFLLHILWNIKPLLK